MNLLLLDQFSDLGGAQLCLLDLLPAIRERGWHAVVAAPGNGPLLARAIESGASPERTHFGIYTRGKKSVADVLRFAIDVPRLRTEIQRLVRKHRIDLVYVNGPRVALAAVWAVGRRLPLTYHCHSYVPGPYGSLLVGRPLASAGATVIANSRFAAKSLGPFAETHIVYNGVADCARPRCVKNPDRIGVIGRISPEKGQLEFVEAARILHQRGGNLEFEIAGSASSDESTQVYNRNMRQAAKGLPIVFSDWTDDIGSVLARLDVLVVPSKGPEATTRVILEAYSAGVLVAAFRTGGIPEVLEHGCTGILAEETTPQALANAVEQLVGKNRHEMAQAARAMWQSRFTLERYQREVLNLLARCRSDFESPQERME